MAFFRKTAAGRELNGQAKAPLVGLSVPDSEVPVTQMPAFAGATRPNLEGALYPDASFETFARLGMGRNELVGACITEKASSLPQSTLRVYPDSHGQGEALEDHPLRRLLADPNPVTTEFELHEIQMVYKDLAGACWTLIERARDGITPARIWPLRPDKLRVLPSPSSLEPWRYRWLYVPDLTKPDLVVPVDPQDMVRVRYPNPLDDYFGWPPLRPAARAISLDNATTDYVDTLLRNAAVPGVVVTSQSIVDNEIAERLGVKWRMKFGGSRRGEPAFLQAGMDVKVLGLNLEQLQFGDLTATSEARICMSLGVPPILIGARVGLDRSTFANYGEARVSFWEETMMPDQGRFLAGYTQKLLPGFLGVGRRRVWLRWDNSGVLALRESEGVRWERATTALRAGGITINDFRRTVGLPPVNGGDVFLTPAGVAPTALGTAPATPATRPPPAGAADDDGAETARQAASYAEQVLAKARQLGPDRHHGIHVLEQAALAAARRNGGDPHGPT
jgi:HK97 family phage portal protein